ncbi:MAG: hypothetical protein M4579_006698 [Chaenotheca gracillima]|nr:MAG: hypothetical protein M4579_006698 [Chaenotheca gracillima]
MGSNANPPPNLFNQIPQAKSSHLSQHEDKPFILKDFAVSDARNLHVDTMLAQARPRSNIPNNMTVSPYSDFLPFQANHREMGGLDGPFPTTLDSPKQLPDGIPSQGRESFSDPSAGRNSVSSSRDHRMSVSSSGRYRPHPGPDSQDGSDVASPESARGRGSISFTADDNNDRDDGSENPVSANPDRKGSKTKDDQSETLPPWSDMKTKAGKERKRLPLACIACRRKKIRCSGEKPACKHCLRSRIPCVYKVTTRKAAPRTDYMAMLDKRLKRMEDRIIKIIPKEESGNTLAFGRATVKPTPPTSAAVKGVPVKKRAADEAFGSELDEWTKNRGPQSSEIENTRPADPDTGSLSEGAESLPPKEIQEHLAEVFFDSLYGQSYHLLHKPSFMRRLHAGSVPPVLMLAVCGISARFSTHPQLNTEPNFLRGEPWAAAAREIVQRRYDEPNITILIVMIILGLHEFGTCQGGRSWAFGGMAIRMAFALQLHRDLEKDPLGRSGNVELSPTDREIRRRTMWSCFLMDRFNSSGTDRPTFIDEDTIKVQLPIKESLFQMEIPGPTETLDGTVRPPGSPVGGQMSDPKENMGVAAYLIRAVALWGRVIKYLNLGGKDNEQHPMWSPDSEFGHLQSQAKGFVKALPESLQYNSENLHTHSTEKLATQFVFLHIAANQVILFMNRSAISAPAGPFLKDAPKDFRSKMGRTAIEAANQISLLIHDATDYSVSAPFAGYSAYCSSTVHVFGVFSNNPHLKETSKKYLAYNVKYLTKMKKYWGMFHFMAENLKEQYRQHADAALNGSRNDPNRANPSAMFHYGDWFDQYPHGVSGTDYEDPAPEVKKEERTDSILRQKSDLQSVGQMIANLGGQPRPDQQRPKAQKRQSIKQAHQASAQSKQAPTSLPMHGIDGADPSMAQSLSGQINLTSPNHHLGEPSFSQQLNNVHNDPNMYNPQGQGHSDAGSGPFPPDFSPEQFNSLLAGHQQQQPFLPQLDRHLVYNAYAGMDPVASASGMQNSIWDVDMTGLGGGGYMNDQTSAWYMPFNLQPPEIGNEADGGFGPSLSAPGGGLGPDMTAFLPPTGIPSDGPGGNGSNHSANGEGGGGQTGSGMG